MTTPESATLLLTRADARERLSSVHTVIVDEWHEMVGNKRGVQVQLALARLQRWNPQLVVWGLSATLGNLDEAMLMLLGARPSGVLVQGKVDKPLDRRHAAAARAGPLLVGRPPRRADGSSRSCTRSRPAAPRWSSPTCARRPRSGTRCCCARGPSGPGCIALHHGSLDRDVRAWVEQGLKAGTLKAVVATSSLDLGVDFLPVERVLQIGSAKGVARLLQRAGRSGHQPGRVSRVTLVPTNTLELVEAVAARRAVAAGRIEKRFAPDKPLDVLVQHLVSMALGGGFVADALFDEVRSAYSYRALTREEFQWALDFVTRGGSSLKAYPEYHRVVQGDDGVYRVPDRGIALRHRLQVGTIVSDASMLVKWLSGGTIGQIEEGFIARLHQGDHFVFAGRVLEYVRTHDMAAYVRKATRKSGIVPAWAGGKMPLSSELAEATLEALESARQGDFFEPELQAALPMLQAQSRLSKLPTPKTLLIEQHRSREGFHVFIYPFAGRYVHLGLASLLAWRLARAQPNTFSMSFNDYGFELLAAEPLDAQPLLDQSAFDDGELLHDVLASLNSSELALRRFREIARVAGLVFTGYPGAPKSTKQLQASSSLFYEVFRKYDPGQQAARPGRRRSAGAGARHPPPAREPEAHARAAGRGGDAAGAEPVRAGADGRALPRGAVDREAGRPAGSNPQGRQRGDATARRGTDRAPRRRIGA